MFPSTPNMPIMPITNKHGLIWNKISITQIEVNETIAREVPIVSSLFISSNVISSDIGFINCRYTMYSIEFHIKRFKV